MSWAEMFPVSPFPVPADHKTKKIWSMLTCSMASVSPIKQILNLRLKLGNGVKT